MAHWLDGLTDLFTCKTTDLAELARIAGYDPEDFYRGTLSEEAIRQDVVSQSQDFPDKLENFDGDFGSCKVNVAEEIHGTFRAEAIIFSTLGELNNAILKKRIVTPLVAVLREREPIEASLLTPGLSILVARDIPSAMIVDISLPDRSGAIPVASSFAPSRRGARSVTDIKSHEIIEFDFDDAWLRSVSDEDGETPRRVARQLALQFGSDVSDFSRGSLIPLHAENIRLSLEALDSLGPQDVILRTSYLRIIRYSCLEIESELPSLATKRLRSADQVVEQLSQDLPFCARQAFAVKQYSACDAALRLALRIPDHFDLTSDDEGATVRILLGNLEAARSSFSKAIGWYQAALRSLEVDRDGRARDITSDYAIVELQQRLVRLYKKTGKRDLAIEALGDAAVRLHRLTDRHGQARDYIMLAGIYAEMAKLAIAEGDVPTAVEHVEDAVFNCQISVRVQLSRNSVSRLARLFRDQAEMYRRLGEASEAVRSLLSTICLRLTIFADRHSLREADALNRDLSRLARLQNRNRNLTSSDQELIANVFAILGSGTWSSSRKELEALQALESILKIWRTHPDILDDIVANLHRSEAGLKPSSRLKTNE